MVRYNRGKHYGRTNVTATDKPLRSRAILSRTVGGIDTEILDAFFDLSEHQLDQLFILYREKFGQGATGYARRTYPDWKKGKVRLSGPIAERLLDLVPRVLDAEVRYNLTKKLWEQFRKQEHKHIKCSPDEWRSKVFPIVDALVATSESFELPHAIQSRIRWLSEGDAAAAQQLLAAIEQEEAAIRLTYLHERYNRILWMSDLEKGGVLGFDLVYSQPSPPGVRHHGREYQCDNRNASPRRARCAE